jgi:hypothetical protein
MSKFIFNAKLKVLMPIIKMFALEIQLLTCCPAAERNFLALYELYHSYILSKLTLYEVKENILFNTHLCLIKE